MALERPFDDGRVQTANVAVRKNIEADIILMFTAKRPLYIRHSDIDETAETGVADE